MDRQRAPWWRSAALALLACLVWPAEGRDLPPYVESLLAGDDAIVVRGAAPGAPVLTFGRRFGGSGVSLYYRGVEYINNDSRRGVDYGRQLQSAVQYRDGGECFNPTEAGGRYDHSQPRSSSVLIEAKRGADGSLTTETEMAFWMAPDTAKDKKNETCVALNDKIRDGFRLRRFVHVGYEGHDNVIVYNTQFFAPRVEPKPRYVPIVTHAPKSFTKVFEVRPTSLVAEPATRRNRRGPYPFLQATPDERHAIVVCWRRPTGNYFYGYTRFPDVTTSRVAFFADKPERESRPFENLVIVGTVDEVRSATVKFCF